MTLTPLSGEMTPFRPSLFAGVVRLFFVPPQSELPKYESSLVLHLCDD